MAGDDSAWFHAGHAAWPGKRLCFGKKQAGPRGAGRVFRYFVSGAIRHRIGVRDGKGLVR
jgi:hypothetical protein